MIEFWFELASTYSYPAAMRVEELANRNNQRLVWRPFLLGPIFKKQQWNDSPFNIYPEKGRYMWRDLERICESQNIPFRRPSNFPRHSLFAARVACIAVENEWGPRFVQNVYLANFAHDEDIAEPSVLLSCLNGLVSNPETVLVEANSDRTKAKLRDNTAVAMEKGIFGAPTLTVGNELFWGNDRVEAALNWKR